MGGWTVEIGNETHLSPAKLELGLGLSLAIPICGSILQAEACPIFNLSSNQRWSQMCQYPREGLKKKLWKIRLRGGRGVSDGRFSTEKNKTKKYMGLKHWI